MATYKYFSNDQEIRHPLTMKNAEFALRFPGVKGRRIDGYAMLVGHPVLVSDFALLPITRVIAYKSNPSLHKCDDRCRHAKGGNCECSCGGQFHGIGG